MSCFCASGASMKRSKNCKMVEKPKSGTVDIGGLWTEPDSDGDSKEKLSGGRFVLDLPRKPLPLAMAAPGMHQ